MSNPAAAFDDPALIAQVARADSAALAELYDRYNQLVFSVALAVVSDEAAAEEIMLDVFVLVWRRAATYHPDRAKVSTWLIAIARHHAIDFMRHRGSRAESKTIAWELEMIPAGSHARALEENVELSQRRDRIRGAIAQLPADQQEALSLAFFGGLTHQEIAGRLGQPLGTIKTRIRLAMAKLRGLLHDEQPPPDTSG